MGLIIKNVSKKYRDKVILNRISLNIQDGQVFALLGKNGAGKSTLINSITKLVRPDTGEIIINGVTSHHDTDNSNLHMGFQSQYDLLIEELNAFDYLQFMALLYKMDKDDINKQIKLLIAYFFEETHDLKRPISTYSTGMRKKIAICAAFIHRPAVVVLDEPFSNIDVVASNALCELITSYKNKNRCILISSHDLLYVEKIATHIGVLNNGTMVFNDELNKFRINTDIDQDLLHHVNTIDSKKHLLGQII